MGSGVGWGLVSQCWSEDAHDGEGRRGQQSRGWVVWLASETAREVLGEGLLPRGLEVQVPGEHGRVAGHDREPPSEPIRLVLVVGGDGRERFPERNPRRLVGWSGIELFEDPMEPVCVVGQDEVVLGGEVREERAWCDPSGRGDLFDRGPVVAIAFEQFEGDILETSSPLALISFPEPRRCGHLPDRSDSGSGCKYAVTAHILR